MHRLAREIAVGIVRATPVLKGTCQNVPPIDGVPHLESEGDTDAVLTPLSSLPIEPVKPPSKPELPSLSPMAHVQFTWGASEQTSQPVLKPGRVFEN